MRPLAFALGALTFLILVGCGGSQVGGPGLPPSSELTLDGDAAFNGLEGTMSGGVSTEVANGRTVVTLRNVLRNVRVELPAPTLTDGQTFTIGGEGGATVRFTQTQERDPVALTWVGTSGSITVRVDPRTQFATIDLHAAEFEGDATIEGNLADGSFTLQGNILGVEFSGGGNVGGEASLAFSSVNDVNASTSSLNTDAVLYAHVESHALLAASSNDRLLSVNLLPSAQTGDVITLNGALNPKASVVFAAGNGNPAKIWLAKGGTLRILARTATQARVELVNATFRNPAPQTGNAATGTFTLNGTIEAD